MPQVKPKVSTMSFEVNKEVPAESVWKKNNKPVLYRHPPHWFLILGVSVFWVLFGLILWSGYYNRQMFQTLLQVSFQEGYQKGGTEAVAGIQQEISKQLTEKQMLTIQTPEGKLELIPRTYAETPSTYAETPVE